MSRKWFGTDGVRGRVGDSVIHPEWVLKLGWAAGHVLTAGATERPRVVIGKDTRLSGYLLESALESGLASAGVDVLLVGPLPTPAIAYLTRTLRADAGIVISASHNPYQDNGIKFFSGDGYKLPDAQEEAIEAWMDRPMLVCDSEQLGKARRVEDAAGRYVEFCKTTFPANLDLRGLHLVVDCAHGANYKVGPMVFRELGAQLTLLGVEPNGININAGVGSTCPESLQEQVRSSRADLGIAFDGDGDRLILVDGQGALLDGDELIWLLARDMQQQGILSGVVGTVMSNLALEQGLAELGVPFVRSAVGDRYVLEAMQQHAFPLGGESSGHIITPANTTGDAILAALRVLAIMRKSGKSLKALREGYQPYPQVLIGVRLADARRLLDHPAAQERVAAAEQELADQGRLLVRPSGTEPLLRVMVEAVSVDLAARVAEKLAKELSDLAPG
ncbi:phosphoglucosamine mutase [Acidithiobacillus thiooxidans]|uniref:Phosphoglucosamine mutase n=1 Tax=Acidithiobacillus thiooxidans TaxID=930 RepID=A0A1C2IA44_ACITH|nr:phosphoglucosamine mutase [Acidithiobacillus thiooxidans]OCX72043.1 phosphoglucosamine mutase [Acidithiobacillus thiooxidans]OCX72800.1 phosphoglucosamine mutase [Acidithiobacillus thiooxidans]OCX74860.1 phosphoglucosamine mutase [Acidithiobacillus thiooxidans]OCX79046.1 phosphoglucosamine mutase [Acidithiobacillus thiooxidans]OCX85076.1 phosphoglucosamine mutase [Acidithiobacillus thiooxidans]